MLLVIAALCLAVMCAVTSAPAAEAQDGRVVRVASVRALDAAVKKAEAGDRIVLQDGLWPDAKIRFRGIGREDAPIVLSAETAGKVLLTGTSSLAIGGQWLVVEGLLFQDEKPLAEKVSQVISFRVDSKTLARDCRVTNCAVVDFSPPDPKTDTRWVSLYGERNRVDHCAFINKTNLGTTLVVWLQSAPDYRPVRHRIDHNYFADLMGDGARSALTLMEGIENSPLSGYSPVKNALIAHNTWVNTKHCFTIGEGAGDGNQSVPPRDCTVANNLVVARHAPLIEVLDAGTSLRFVGNIFHGAELGVPVEVGIRVVDPQLRKSSDGLWRPSMDSPAVDAAESLMPAVALDMDGQERKGRADVGADEHSNELAQRRVLQSGDVGPDWRK